MTPALRQTLLDVIARLENCSGISRLLDLEIHIAGVKDEIWPARDWYGRITNPDSRMSDYVEAYRDVIDRDNQDFDIPRYTASVDAALMLVPEGMEWSVTTLYGPASVEVGLNVSEGGPCYGRREDGNVAVAICIAALKAREALLAKEGDA